MSAIIDRDSTIHIIGTGTFGLSTALDLARNGYSNITCFDKYPVPSNLSAGNDSNKILDYEYIAPDETPSPDERIRLEALEQWKLDPVFKDNYHSGGFLLTACSDKPLIETKERVEYLKKKNFKDYEYVDSPEAFRKHLPVLKGDLPGWRGYVLDKDNGWLHARNSLKSAHAECVKLGVKFVFEDDGEIVDFKFKQGEVESIVAKSGKEYVADRYVLTAGANVVSILDFKKQLESKCWTLAHIKVTDEEAEAFKGLPVIFNVEKGFFFEADENNEIKICNEFPGYTRFNDKGDSIPFYCDEIPVEAAEGVRQYLRETMPQFANREFVKTKICWCTDSPNRQLILTTHPDYKNLVIGSGDSGRSFMIMPAIGKYISKVVISGNDGLTKEEQDFWRWRPETSKLRDDTQDRYGGSGKVKDLKELDKWVSVENPVPHLIQLD